MTDLGSYTYSIVGHRLEIRLSNSSITTVYPRHSILSVTYIEGSRISLKLVDGSAVEIMIPFKGTSDEPDLRFTGKMRKIYTEICDLFLT